MKRLSPTTPLIRLTSALPEVRDYYRGLQHGRSPDGLLPDNLLLFSRHDKNRHNLQPGRLRSFHRRFVLIANLAGRGTVEVDGAAVELKPGACLMIRPFQFHCYPIIPRAGFCWLFITFDMPQAEHRAAATQGVALDGDMIHLLHLLLRDRLKAAGAPETAWRMGLTLATLLDLCEHASPTKPASAPPRPAAGPAWSARLIDAIRSPGRLSMRIDDLAEELGWSASHLRAAFRERFGVSLGKYLRDYRLNLAQGLLARPDHSIKQIAELAGFSSVYSFGRAFAKQAGMPPGKYQRMTQRRM